MFRSNIYHKTRQSPLKARHLNWWLTQHCLAIYCRSLWLDYGTLASRIFSIWFFFSLTTISSGLCVCCWWCTLQIICEDLRVCRVYLCVCVIQSAGQVFDVAESFRRRLAINGRQSREARVPQSYSRPRQSTRHSHVSRSKQQASPYWRRVIIPRCSTLI